MVSTTLPGGTFKLADDLILTRMGYGAMQLAGPHVFGPPKDHDGAIEVLREIVRLGINHVDTSDFYGPHITNQLIKEALHPYPEQLRIVTKVGARRDAEGNWSRALAGVTPSPAKTSDRLSLLEIGCSPSQLTLSIHAS
jgi:pyridoxine 4-dehydrogenase